MACSFPIWLNSLIYHIFLAFHHWWSNPQECGQFRYKVNNYEKRILALWTHQISVECIQMQTWVYIPSLLTTYRLRLWQLVWSCSNFWLFPLMRRESMCLAQLTMISPDPAAKGTRSTSKKSIQVIRSSWKHTRKQSASPVPWKDAVFASTLWGAQRC